MKSFLLLVGVCWLGKESHAATEVHVNQKVRVTGGTADSHDFVYDGGRGGEAFLVIDPDWNGSIKIGKDSEPITFDG